LGFLASEEISWIDRIVDLMILALPERKSLGEWMDTLYQKNPIIEDVKLKYYEN
jgi:hypothetical protein